MFSPDFNARYSAILDSERERRDAPFALGAAAIPLADGIDLAPFTLRRWALLDLIDSPLLLAASSDKHLHKLLIESLPRFAGEFALNLWPLTVQWGQNGDSGAIRAAFISAFDNLPQAVKESVAERTVAHIVGAFYDAPPGGREGKIPLASHIAYVIQRIASHYHWREYDLLNVIPLSRVWQYFRLIEISNDPDAISYNPSDIERGHLWQQAQRLAKADKAAKTINEAFLMPFRN